MEEPFNFEKIGKKMPYSVPENFFDTMEENLKTMVMETDNTPTHPIKKNNHRKWVYLTTGIVAAVALLLLTVHIFLPKQSASDYSFDQVELAFNNLSMDDQNFLMEVYEDDIFMAVDN
ncbi:MAG: hypothetical protein J5644_09890 [Bacteroidales bacterium]|nr:hypothetical protein [Bacteroidales bacterium]